MVTIIIIKDGIKKDREERINKSIINKARSGKTHSIISSGDWVEERMECEPAKR